MTDRILEFDLHNLPSIKVIQSNLHTLEEIVHLQYGEYVKTDDQVITRVPGGVLIVEELIENADRPEDISNQVFVSVDVLHTDYRFMDRVEMKINEIKGGNND